MKVVLAIVVIVKLQQKKRGTTFKIVIPLFVTENKFSIL